VVFRSRVDTPWPGPCRKPGLRHIYLLGRVVIVSSGEVAIIVTVGAAGKHPGACWRQALRISKWGSMAAGDQRAGLGIA